MSASKIPDLRTIRRGDARGKLRAGTERPDTQRSQDDVVRSTDNDAATSRSSAVQAGYLDDPFAALLCPCEMQRRLPLMNRGTYVRTAGIDKIVDAFITSHQRLKQIISLGAGSDTRYLNLMKRQKNLGLDIVYHEIDFNANTHTKIERLKAAADEIQHLCGVNIHDAETVGSSFRCGDYYIHARDLRQLDNGPLLPGIADIPTLLISECCLIYLAPKEADTVLSHFLQLISNPVAIVIYEPIRPYDSFGRTMVRNLTARGILLQTFEQYAEPEDQRQRLVDLGFEARAADTAAIWNMWIDNTEKERIDGLEWMDEVEEFTLLAKHYCIAWGWKQFESDVNFKALPTCE